LNYDNPAGRLLAILKKGKTIHGHKVCKDVWFELLQASDDAEMLSRLGLLMELSKDAAIKVKEDFPSESESVAHWKSQLNSAFISQNLQSNWQSFIGNIDVHTINYLSNHSTMLSLISNTKSVVDDDVEKIRDKLLEIYEEILLSNIEQEIRIYLIRHIRKILTGIDEYFLTGALPILEAVETTIGHAYLHKNYASFLRDEKLGKKVLDMLNATASVVTVAAGLTQIPTVITLLLT
jgi:uncharacterized protein YlzI (FlbEa/FlbD family)